MSQTSTTLFSPKRQHHGFTILGIIVIAICGFLFIFDENKANKFIFFGGLFFIWLGLSAGRKRYESIRDSAFSLAHSSASDCGSKSNVRLDARRQTLATWRGFASLGNAMMTSGGVIVAVKILSPLTYTLIIVERFLDLKSLRNQLVHGVPGYTTFAKWMLGCASLAAVGLLPLIPLAVVKQYALIANYLLPADIFSLSTACLLLLRSRFQQLFDEVNNRGVQSSSIRRLLLVTEYSASIRALFVPGVAIATYFQLFDPSLVQGIGITLLTLNYCEAVIHIVRAKRQVQAQQYGLLGAGRDYQSFAKGQTAAKVAPPGIKCFD